MVKAQALNQIVGFDCSSMSPNGVSKITYQSNPEFKVLATRNWILNIQYELHAHGNVGPSLESYGPYHFTLAEGGLASNQYLSFIASEMPRRGGRSAISGTVLLVTQGGSLFAPTVGSVLKVGTFSCDYFELR